MKTERCVVALLALVLVALPTVADWPHLRGPAVDGRVAAPGTFETEDIGLALSWRIPLGSAYSGIAVSGGRAVTMFADTEADWVAAFNTRTGKEIWRHRLGELNRGHDGSDDGPLSSPIIGNGHVFALHPAGYLKALRLKNGEAVWQVDLAKDLGGKAPSFGYTTTPLLVDDVLVVQIGAPERSIVGLDARSGKVLWSHGEDAVNYQSPALMSLGGEQQIVAVSATQITGLAADNGEVLWTHSLAEGERSRNTNPTAIGDDRFLAAFSGASVMFRVSVKDGKHVVEELFRSEALGRNYVPPVHHDGHLYGFRGQVLTCVNAQTGERVWRSRPPGGDGLIIVDGHLVIFGAKGNVVVADASPAGYRERARIQALDGSSLTWPSFDDGRVFVRNLDEMAAIEITNGSKGPRIAAAAGQGTKFVNWTRRLAAADNKLEMVNKFLVKHPTSPVVSGDHVHFFYIGDAEDVAVAGSMNDTDGAEIMARVEGTDLFWRSYRLEPGARWEYRYQIDYETWITDPRNDREVPALDDEEWLSEVETPGYESPDYLTEPAGARGRVDEFTLSSKALEYDKEIKIWLPPGYDEGLQNYPLLVVNDGTTWLDKGRMVQVLDNLVGKSVRPVVVAFVAPDRRWWTEAGGSATEQYVKMQVEELVPELSRRYRLEDSPASRGLMGNRYYGFSAAYAVLKNPQTFGHAALQSIYLGMGLGDEIRAMIEGKSGQSTEFYLDWNRYDERNIDRGWDLGADSEELAGLLRRSGYTLAGGERLDSTGWSGWRNRTGEILARMFPAEGG